VGENTNRTTIQTFPNDPTNVMGEPATASGLVDKKPHPHMKSNLFQALDKVYDGRNHPAFGRRVYPKSAYPAQLPRARKFSLSYIFL
jgi:hypothetical protein